MGEKQVDWHTLAWVSTAALICAAAYVCTPDPFRHLWALQRIPGDIVDALEWLDLTYLPKTMFEGPEDPLDRALWRWRAMWRNPLMWVFPDCWTLANATARGDLQRLLFEAVDRRNATALSEVLRRARDEAGFDPVELARGARSRPLRHQLRGAPDRLPPCRLTLMQHAAATGARSMLEPLADAGADPVDGAILCAACDGHEVRWDHYTPLYLAMAKRRRDIALWLLALNRTEHLGPLEEEGDMLDDRKRDGHVLLMAHRQADEELVRVMLESGAGWVLEEDRWRSREHAPVLPDALGQGRLDRVPDHVLEAMRRGLFDMWPEFHDCASWQAMESNPFALAARARNGDLFDSLLSARLQHGRDGEPLMPPHEVAATFGLLAESDDLREPYALRLAEARTPTEVYAEFLMHWANRTPLHVAACFGRPELLRALLRNANMGADVECNGRTPLYMATACGDCAECAEVLATEGANPNLMVNGFPLWRHAKSPEVLRAIGLHSALYASRLSYLDAMRRLCEPRWERGEKPQACQAVWKNHTQEILPESSP